MTLLWPQEEPTEDNVFLLLDIDLDETGDDVTVWVGDWDSGECDE